MSDDLREIAGLLKETQDVAKSVLNPSANGIAQINVSAGGVAVWIAVSACAAMVAVTIVASIFIAVGYADLNRQTQELRQADALINAYIAAGYTAPKEQPK